jgi:hypothetical protein
MPPHPRFPANAEHQSLALTLSGILVRALCMTAVCTLLSGCSSGVARTLIGDYPDRVVSRADSLSLCGHHQEALAEINKITWLGWTDPFLYERKASILEAAGKSSEAVEAINCGIKLSNADTKEFFLSRRAELNANAGKLADSVADYSAAIAAMDHSDADMFWRLSQLYAARASVRQKLGEDPGPDAATSQNFLRKGHSNSRYMTDLRYGQLRVSERSAAIVNQLVDGEDFLNRKTISRLADPTEQKSLQIKRFEGTHSEPNFNNFHFVLEFERTALPAKEQLKLGKKVSLSTERDFYEYSWGYLWLLRSCEDDRLVERVEFSSKKLLLADLAGDWVLAAQSELESGKYEKALELATMAEKNGMEGYNDCLFPHLLKARIYRKLRNFDRSIAECNLLLPTQTLGGNAYLERAQTFADKGDVDSALRDYATAIQKTKTNYGFRLDRAKYFVKLNRYAEAIADINALKPDSNAELLQLRAQAEVGLCKTADAVCDLKKAWQIYNQYDDISHRDEVEKFIRQYQPANVDNS